jgi:ribonuclease Z
LQLLQIINIIVFITNFIVRKYKKDHLLSTKILQMHLIKLVSEWGAFMVDICLLGCGGMLPLQNRRLSSLLIRYKGKMILVDCGEGTQVGVRAAGWGFKQIDTLCLTHYHADHVAGLPGFLLTLGNSGRTEPLTILGPPMLNEIVNSLTVISPELPYELRLIELGLQNGSQYKDGEINIRSLPVNHWMPCLAYSFEIERQRKFNVEVAKELGIPVELWNKLQNGETVCHQGNIYASSVVLGEKRKGIKLTYCTDSRPTDSLIDFCDNSDLLVCEGMYGSDDLLQKAIDKKHMIFSEAASIAKNSKVKELWLTHFSPSLEAPELFINNAIEIFENSNLGHDLMTTTLKW